MKIFVAGTFDHFHVGHQWLLWSSVEQGSEVVVVVARDATVEKIKGFAPTFTEIQRLQRVQQECLPKALVRLGDAQGNFCKTLEEENPDLVFLGYDQHCPIEVEAMATTQRCSAYFPEVFKSSFFRR